MPEEQFENMFKMLEDKHKTPFEFNPESEGIGEYDGSEDCNEIGVERLRADGKTVKTADRYDKINGGRKVKNNKITYPMGECGHIIINKQLGICRENHLVCLECLKSCSICHQPICPKEYGKVIDGRLVCDGHTLRLHLEFLLYILINIFCEVNHHEKFNPSETIDPSARVKGHVPE